LGKRRGASKPTSARVATFIREMPPVAACATRFSATYFICVALCLQGEVGWYVSVTRCRGGQWRVVFEPRPLAKAIAFANTVLRVPMLARRRRAPRVGENGKDERQKHDDNDIA